MKDFDVIVIGAGGVGCAIAREFSRFKLKVAVLEKECDVAFGTSGRNSAVVHAGFNNKPGSLMARLCVEGNEGFEEECRLLGVSYRKTGKVLTAFDDSDMEILENLIRQGEANGCRDLRLIDSGTLKDIVPNVGGIGGMLSPRTAIFDPFGYTIALAENAAANGTEFFFEQEVFDISKTAGSGFVVSTREPDGRERQFRASVLVNSAGLFSDRVSAMAGVPDYRIYPCRGEYYILDKGLGILDIPVYPAPRKGIGGLGVHLTPTIDGNIIIGPSATYIDDKADYASTKPVMDQLFSEARMLLPLIERRMIIGSYTGLRSKLAPPDEGGYHDFIIREEETMKGLINLIGIESPGLTASIPIGRMVTRLAGLQEKDLKEDFIRQRKAPVRFRELSDEQKRKLIAEDREWGEVVCRCQQVTRKEIRMAIENPLGARSLASIKYRAWATTGRCQGGYCLNRICEMLTREYGMKPEELTLRGEGGNLFTGVVK